MLNSDRMPGSKKEGKNWVVSPWSIVYYNLTLDESASQKRRDNISISRQKEDKEEPKLDTEFTKLPGLKVLYEPVEVNLTGDVLKGILSQPSEEGRTLFRYWTHKGLGRNKLLDFYNASKDMVKPVNLDSKVDLEITSHGEKESAIWLMGLLTSDPIINHFINQDKAVRTLLKASGINNSELYNGLKERRFPIAEGITNISKYQSQQGLIVVRYDGIERARISELVGSSEHPLVDVPLVFSVANADVRIIQSNYNDPQYFAYLFTQEENFSRGIVSAGDKVYFLEKINGEVKPELLLDRMYAKEIDPQPNLDIFVKTLRGGSTTYSMSVKAATASINFALSGKDINDFPDFFSKAQNALSSGRGYYLLSMISGDRLYSENVAIK